MSVSLALLAWAAWHAARGSSPMLMPDSRGRSAATLPSARLEMGSAESRREGADDINFSNPKLELLPKVAIREEK